MYIYIYILKYIERQIALGGQLGEHRAPFYRSAACGLSHASRSYMIWAKHDVARANASAGWSWDRKQANGRTTVNESVTRYLPAPSHHGRAELNTSLAPRIMRPNGTADFSTARSDSQWGRISQCVQTNNLDRGYLVPNAHPPRAAPRY